MSSAVRETIAAYVAGRVEAERVVIAATVAYYGEGGKGEGQGEGEALKPIIDIIDRASPGIVELGSVASNPGFEVRLAERSFPKQYEPDLRRAAQAVLATAWARGTGDEGRVRPARPGLVARLVKAIGRMFGQR
ncbi:MAG TPA: hypothetical protein VFU41_09520 [Gemmatimonadales bacterium]|nr:hypothetical protein [Gemmatimonadales bacterium]